MSTILKDRDYYFDNGKFILIFLVVFGHLISPVKDQSELLFTIYNFIYTFHMPAFILISGYFTKGFFKTGYLRKILKKLLVPYVIFQIIYSFYYYNLYDKTDLSFSLFQPHWSLWFLLSLACWNLLLPLFLRLKHPLIWSLAIGVAVGYIPDMGTWLSLSRTFVFFPVFLAGHFLNKEHVKNMLQPGVRMTALGILSVLFLTYHFVLPDATKEWLLASSSYAEILGHNVWYSGFIRLLIYAAVFMTTFCVLAIIPKRQFFFTKLGPYTLYVYLLHGFVLKFFFTTNLFGVIEEQNAYIFLLIMAVVLTLLLASRPVTRIAQPMIELKWKPFNWDSQKEKAFSK